MSEDRLIQAFVLRLNSDIQYDQTLGSFTWLSGRFKGLRVGTPCNGYLTFGTKGNRIKLHRVVYYIHNNTLPKILDHINMDKLDNRITNLRPADKSLNQRNQPLRTDNTSGYKGVSLHGHSCWIVRVSYKGKYPSFGTYKTKEEAALVYNYVLAQLTDHVVVSNNRVDGEVPNSVALDAKIKRLMEGER